MSVSPKFIFSFFLFPCIFFSVIHLFLNGADLKPNTDLLLNDMEIHLEMKLFHGAYIESFLKYRKIAKVEKCARNTEVFYDKYSSYR